MLEIDEFQERPATEILSPNNGRYEAGESNFGAQLEFIADIVKAALEVGGWINQLLNAEALGDQPDEPREVVLDDGESVEQLKSSNTDERLEYEQRAATSILEQLVDIPVPTNLEWRTQTLEQRITYAVAIHESCMNAFGISTSLEFQAIPEFGKCTPGGHIVLGEAALFTTPDELIKTVLHEFKHAHQFTEIHSSKQSTDPLLAGFDLVAIEKWQETYSMQSHIYQNHAMELDAEKFALNVYANLITAQKNLA